MSNLDRVDYLRIALGMTGVGVSNATSEIILRTFEAVEKMGGDFSLEDACKIEHEVLQKYESQENAVKIETIKNFYNEITKKDSLNANEIMDGLKTMIEMHQETPH
jgi:hypothetical protein